MYVDHEVNPQPNDCFKEAKFRLWYDAATLKDARGILTLTPGSGADGRADIKHWSEFARKNKLIILGVMFSDVEFKVDEDYIDAKNGSGSALLKAVFEFEQELDHMPLDLKFFMWGHSAGGEFNYEFACWCPQRVAAFVVNKGGIYYTGLAPKATRAIPAAFFIGKKDAEYRKEAVRAIYAMGAVSGGADDWTLWIDPGSHEVGDSERVARELFENTLNGMEN